MPPPLEGLAPASSNDSSYLTAPHEPLIQLPGGVPWQQGLVLPIYALDVRPPAPDLNRYAPTTPDAHAPVLPSLFLPGFPKSATTWLFNCMLAAFAPREITSLSDWLGSVWGSLLCRLF